MVMRRATQATTIFPCVEAWMLMMMVNRLRKAALGMAVNRVSTEGAPFPLERPSSA